MVRLLRLVCALVLILSAPLAAFEWPVSEVSIVRLFGQKAGVRVERGIVLRQTDVVRASGNGAVLMILEQSRAMNAFPCTLGNAVILAHDDGLATAYGNLGPVERLKERLVVETGDILAEKGESGWMPSGAFSFQVFDQVKRTSLNPLLLLPALADKRAPVIKGVIAVSQSNQSYALGTAKYARQGKYRFYADVVDAVEGSSAELAPFRVTVLVNGRENSSLSFELVRTENGRNYLGTREYTADRLYGDGGRMYIGEVSLPRGKTDITVIARDAAGNERTAQFTLQVD